MDNILFIYYISWKGIKIIPNNDKNDILTTTGNYKGESQTARLSTPAIVSINLSAGRYLIYGNAYCSSTNDIYQYIGSATKITDQNGTFTYGSGFFFILDFMTLSQNTTINYLVGPLSMSSSKAISEMRIFAIKY